MFHLVSIHEGGKRMRNRWTGAGLVTAGMVLTFSIGLSLGKAEKVRQLNLPGRTDKRPFSHTVVAGETIYIAGSIGLDPDTGKVPEDPMDEARLALDAIKAKLALAGATTDDLVSVQVFCSDLSLYADFNKVYAGYFSKGAPARAFIGAGPLLFEARFEINGIAIKP
jgi:2-iminobutanoate/2-iminopropanoate deaminase